MGMRAEGGVVKAPGCWAGELGSALGGWGERFLNMLVAELLGVPVLRVKWLEMDPLNSVL